MVRIAVVEDEAVSRQLLADYLARYSEENGGSFEVTYFEDGGAIIGDYKPVYDIILMDIQMTHVDGMTAARDPRGRSGGRPRIHHVRRAVRDPRLPGGCTLLPHEAAALVRVLAGTIQVSRGRGQAARRLDDPAKRLIKLALFRQGQMVVIRVDNWFDGRLNTDAGGRLTTIKPDTVRHGWGVKSIQWTARKYGGQAVTDVADHWFTLTVLPPSTNAQEDS